MAFITFNQPLPDGRRSMTVPPEIAKHLYRIQQGIVKGSKAEQAKVAKIKQIYFAGQPMQAEPVQQHWSDMDKDMELA